LCSNRDGIRRGDLEVLILDALRTRLMGPDIVAEFIREFTAEWNRLAAERSAGRTAQERELATITRKLDGLIAAMADGFRAPRPAGAARRAGGAPRNPGGPPGGSAVSAPPRLHLNLAEVYR